MPSSLPPETVDTPPVSGKRWTTVATSRSEIAALLESRDWSRTPLGARETWPASLTGLVRTVLSSPVAMTLLLGPDGIMIYNAGYAAIASGRHPTCFGMSAIACWPEVADFNRTIIDGVLSGECFSYADMEMTLNRSGEPERVWFDLDYSPVFDDEGAISGALAVVVETTKAVEAKQALARNREKLSLALQASGVVGIWDWDVVADRVYADDRFASLYGVDPETAATNGVPISGFTAGIHPDDAERVSNVLQGVMKTGEKLSIEYRLVQADGSVRWVLAEGQPLLENGTCIRFPGIAVDITAQKEVAEAYAQSETGFRTLADTMPQMVWSTRPDGFHDYYNARWYEFTGVPPGSTDGAGWSGIFHPEDQDRAWALWRHSLETGDPYQIEYRLRHHSGAYRWVLGRALPIRDADGRITRWYGTCTDIHDAKMAQAEREVVAHELSHRIKNIFSVLSGIISLSARSEPQARGFAEQLRKRIDAMGRAHDFVRPHSEASRPTMPDTTLFNFLARLLEPYWGEEGKGAIRLHGDDTAIADSAATPLALLLHELGTNSAKYGALSTADGRVEITGRIDGETYHLRWKEKVQGVVISAPEKDGFGSRLMKISAEGQLEGQLERFWEPDGLRIEASIPLSALTRSGRLGRR
ncbi:PAS domain-containing protein [Rhizobiaceae bacterium CRRU44]|uniref:Blue-light-activated histidine kinase n=1 Tax=Ferranicluibacter rubi TaxID=2715133 RepID=A0AA43ZHY2_9HYPH|nr:PAS domain-containing protein [Ferranicluibacter rubi]NHT78223.1 PAS domain-containing protein [Ferranicluibacter rubi]